MYLIRRRQNERAGRWGEKRRRQRGVCYQTEWLLRTHTINICRLSACAGWKCLHALEGWIVASILRMGRKKKRYQTSNPPPVDFCHHLLHKERLPSASFAVLPRIKPHPPGKSLLYPCTLSIVKELSPWAPGLISILGVASSASSLYCTIFNLLPP